MREDRKITLSALFTTYNRVRNKDVFDRRRVDRALGLLMQRDQSWRDEYLPTLDGCMCPDNTGRRTDPETGEVLATWEPHICKHRIAMYIESLIVLTYIAPAMDLAAVSVPELQQYA
jgi:hypothetical protein